MSAAVQLDLDLLNELFDNQKMLDSETVSDKASIFDDINDSLDSTIFDDPFVDSSMSFNDPTLGIKNQNSSLDAIDFHSDENFSLSFDDELFEQKSRSMTAIVVPVVMEIIVISGGLMYFS